VDDGLVQVLVTTVVHMVPDHSLGHSAQLTAINRIRHVADLVNLDASLVPELHIVEQGGGGVAVIESLVSKLDGSHGCFGVL